MAYTVTQQPNVFGSIAPPETVGAAVPGQPGSIDFLLFTTQKNQLISEVVLKTQSSRFGVAFDFPIISKAQGTQMRFSVLTS